MRVALDTNVLAYAEGVNDGRHREAALELVECLPAGTAAIPVQALGELFNVLVRKAGRTKSSARKTILTWVDSFPLIETSASVLLGAVDLAADHRLAIWDAVMLAAAAEADCRLFLSEDLADGFTVRGVTVVNPFSTKRHPLLAELLAPRG